MLYNGLSKAGIPPISSQSGSFPGTTTGDLKPGGLMPQLSAAERGLITKILLAALVVTLTVLLLWLDPGRYLSLDYIKEQRETFRSLLQERPFLTSAGFFLIYITVTALSFPGATLLTLLAGALFGLGWGSVVVSLASTIGATLAFLTARFLVRDWVQARFGEKLSAVNQGIRKEGAFYLLALRLVPAFPFFMINLLMGLTPIRIRTYFLASQLGMLPGTLVYVNAGTRLGEVRSLSGILSFELILSFALLGIFPLIAKKLLSYLRKIKG